MTGRKIEDAGELISGARKHLWGHGLTLEHVREMSAEEAHQTVTKDAVWPVPDYVALIADGAEPEAVALVKIIRDRVTARPSPQAAKRYGAVEVRNGYVNLLGEVRRLSEAAKTVEDVKSVYTAARAHIGAGERAYADRAVMTQLEALRIGNHDPFEVRAADLMKARAMVADGFPAKTEVSPWLRGVVFGRRRNGAFYAFKGRDLLIDDQPDLASAEAGLEERWKRLQEEKSAEPKAPPAARYVPEDACREGMADRRGGADISPQDFIDEFGFRAVQFGQSMPDSERQMVLNRSFDALHDLAVVLDIPVKAISLNGYLAAALGARGINAAAHYEPVQRIYNLGRRRGAGCLAHEWLHAFDHYTAEMSSLSLGPSDGETRYASAGAVGIDLPDELILGWSDLMKTLRQRPGTRDETLAGLDDLIDRQKREIEEQDRLFEKFLASGQQNHSYVRRVAAWKSQAERSIARWESDKEKKALPDYDGGFGTRSTDFLRDAVAISGSKGYMARPWELAARAFESYVFDRISAMGSRSDFLVCGVEPERYADKAVYKGNPYPEGAEREAFNAAYDRLAVGMRMILAPERPMAPRPA